MDQAALVDLAKSMATRAGNADFGVLRARDDERAQLAAATPPIVDAQAQDYVAWRRAVLWVAGVLLAIGFVLAAIDHSTAAEEIAKGQIAANGGQGQLAQVAAQVEHQFGKANLEVVDNLQITMLLMKLTIAVCVLLAARAWANTRRSQFLTRWSWVIAVVVPLGILSYPFATDLDFQHLDGIGAPVQGDQAKQIFGMYFGLLTLAAIGPKLLAMFPGIMRAALTLKTLLPESAVPGWVTVAVAPLFAGFLLLILCVTSQLQGSIVLIAAVTALAMGPVTYLRHAKELVRPHTSAEVTTTVRAVRRTAMLFNLLGAGLLVGYVVHTTAIPWFTLIHLLIEALGGVLLTMVVFSDAMLVMLKFGVDQSTAFQGTPLQAELHARLGRLEAAGLTDVKDAFRLRKDRAEPS